MNLEGLTQNWFNDPAIHVLQWDYLSPQTAYFKGYIIQAYDILKMAKEAAVVNLL